MKFQEIESFDEQHAFINVLSQQFFSRAHQVDIEGSFPYENIQDLKDTGYTSLTVPRKYGGREISLFDMLRFQEKIAEGDGATALSIGWHMGIIKNLTEKSSWDESTFKMLCEDVKKRFIN